MKKIVTLSAIIVTHTVAFGQCANPSNIYSFTFNSHRYEVVKENKTWTEANNCATARGGHLLDINSGAEQAAVNSELNNAGINSNNTKAPDGGNASYIWTAGNDKQTEGKWVWSNSGVQFWSGNVSGSGVSGAYTHWGSVQSKEPDNFINEQHALGLAITNWPNGLKGEWNDIKETNTLYYIVEFDQPLGLSETSDNKEFVLYPNPTEGIFYIQQNGVGLQITAASVYDLLGRLVMTVADPAGINEVNMSALPPAGYLIRFVTADDQQIIRKIQLR